MVASRDNCPEIVSFVYISFHRKCSNSGNKVTFGSFGDQGFYFIISGEVEVYIEPEFVIDVLKDGKCIGYITSGGYAHHVKKSMAMGYVPCNLAEKNTELGVEINGNLYKSKVQSEPLYDPRGTKMRN